MAEHYYWLSTKVATGMVAADENGVIFDTCPIWKQWVGKTTKEMGRYLRERGWLLDFKELLSWD